MELMSILLFCAFVVRLTLGVPSGSDFDVRAKWDSSILNVNSTVISDAEHQALNLNDSSKVDAFTELHPFLSDDQCKHCSSCVENVLDAWKNYLPFHKNISPEFNDLQPSAKSSKTFKRSVRFNFNNTETVKESKHKSIKVTKYKTVDEKVYAIKVNEINNQLSGRKDRKSTCKVYSVKKAYPCESEESNLILMKRKVNKKKIPKQKNKNASTEKLIQPVTSAGFKKRKFHIESSHVPESFMTSIEELY